MLKDRNSLFSTHLPKFSFKQPLPKDQLGLGAAVVAGATSSGQVVAQPAPHTPSTAVAGQPVSGKLVSYVFSCKKPTR